VTKPVVIAANMVVANFCGKMKMLFAVSFAMTFFEVLLQKNFHGKTNQYLVVEGSA
jgi:hypothetical protein